MMRARLTNSTSQGTPTRGFVGRGLSLSKFGDTFLFKLIIHFSKTESRALDGNSPRILEFWLKTTVMSSDGLVLSMFTDGT